MGHIEATRDLTAGPDALWATVADRRHGTNGSRSQRVAGGATGHVDRRGRLTAKIVMLGMASRIEWTIESVDAPHSRAQRHRNGRSQGGFSFTIEPAGTGSRFTVTGDFEGALVKGALARPWREDGVKQLDKSLDALDAGIGVGMTTTNNATEENCA